jgi:uncharacterized damage-inducible protein DinB
MISRTLIHPQIIDNYVGENMPSSVKMLTLYKAWASDLTFSTVQSLPAGEATKERPTRFKNMLHTLNHIYVIDCIFKAHLEGKKYYLIDRNTSTPPPFYELWQATKFIDQWYIDYAKYLSPEQLSESVRFQFIDGREGMMSREEIILHIVNHGTYHRGFVSDLMYQIPIVPPANDLTVFLRDIYPDLSTDRDFNDTVRYYC